MRNKLGLGLLIAATLFAPSCSQPEANRGVTPITGIERLENSYAQRLDGILHKGYTDFEISRLKGIIYQKKHLSHLAQSSRLSESQRIERAIHAEENLEDRNQFHNVVRDYLLAGDDLAKKGLRKLYKREIFENISWERAGVCRVLLGLYGDSCEDILYERKIIWVQKMKIENFLESFPSNERASMKLKLKEYIPYILRRDGVPENLREEILKSAANAVEKRDYGLAARNFCWAGG
ncbi:MAG: hypothetical protein KKD94_05895, partial [Nanoarchaeota archaeon]|nr:hypothetical protein [Nanoarchaeota archaeon]